MTRPPRFNLRRFLLDILAPVLATAALYNLFAAADYVHPYAPVTASLLRLWLVVVVGVGFAAVWQIGNTHE